MHDSDIILRVVDVFMYNTPYTMVRPQISNESKRCLPLLLWIFKKNLKTSLVTLDVTHSRNYFWVNILLPCSTDIK